MRSETNATTYFSPSIPIHFRTSHIVTIAIKVHTFFIIHNHALFEVISFGFTTNCLLIPAPKSITIRIPSIVNCRVGIWRNSKSMTAYIYQNVFADVTISGAFILC